MRVFLYKLSLVVVLVASFSGLRAQQDYAINQLIDRLFVQLENHQYFELRRLYQSNERRLPSIYALYFGAHLDAAFNAPKASNQKIIELLKFSSGALQPDNMLGILTLKQNNHVLLFEYKEAWQTNKFITSTYADLLDSSTLESYRNSEKLWQALLNCPAQRVELTGDVNLNLTKDASGLSCVDVQMDTQSSSFVFDTGANFSVIQRSVAEKLNLEILDVNFQTTAATGKMIESDLAVVPHLSLGDLHVKNAVFIVFDDANLNFPELDYEITGIVGFPIIRALREIHVRENMLFIPKNASGSSNKNFALDGLSPIVELEYNEELLSFHFDTGANATSLFPRFYKKYQSSIDEKYQLENFSTGGAGGIVEEKGFVLKKIKLCNNNQSCSLKNVRLNIHETPLNKNSFGNVGQDFISAFKGYVLNFETSSFWVE